ncbi:MAG TPA: LuxR C-terminal-related transcriptional regulator [Verrucomicrobiae bacterium]|nr:LuxR C-terminal-related transcriptional regulator [Verrucomicrobiae bacterium]
MIKILAFPNLVDQVKRMSVFLSDKIRVSLVDRQSKDSLEFVKEFRSGKRRYNCRIFQLDSPDKGALLVLVLERFASRTASLSQLSEEFDLTVREQETVQLLLQGLTSKEIAARMNISPNTVKAFLRLVMVKMGVSTRSGIVGRIVGPV